MKRIVVASRKSQLARLQSYTVGEALRRAMPGIEIEFQFRESLGDININDPLWKMPEKGVFTQDFHDDLVSGKCDLVVHSWKDLPLERSPGTRLIATLPREDARDLLLVRRDLWEKRSGSLPLEILTSSPRRMHNLSEFLAWALPQPLGELRFAPVRGNIPTRLRKLFEGPSQGLILAKAALDRLLEAPQEEFRELQDEIRTRLAECRFMVLPLSANPTAAAQGALAIEVATNPQPALARLLEGLNVKADFASVEEERRILGRYGGGCHQKIGVNVIERPYGRITFLRGLTDAGEKLDSIRLESSVKLPSPAHRDRVFPLESKDAAFFDRVALNVEKTGAKAYWVARSEAWPAHWKQENELVWTAGLESWRKLAARGLWVNGSSEGLGESEAPRLEEICGPIDWMKLSHEEGVEKNSSLRATYRLVPKASFPDLSAKTHFFWSSGSAFKAALARFPEIRSGWHSSGPGHTHEVLKRELGPTAHISIALNHRSWLSTLGF